MLDETCHDLYALISDACSGCKSKSIAMSGGLDSTILAYFLKDKLDCGTAIIADDFTATDLTYCQTASKEFNLQLSINFVSTKDLLGAVERTIDILGNFNDIEIRNNVVMYLAIKWAKEQGFSGIISGDGADELFAGYNFLLNKSPDSLEGELDRIRDIMHFPAQTIAKSLGVVIESPFLDDRIITFARNLPTDFKVRMKDNKMYGKWILRKAFERFIPKTITWRTKSAMQDGAGTAGLAGLFDSVIDDHTFAEKKRQIRQDGVIIRTKESMYYYEIYKKTHGLDFGGDSGTKCPYCGFGTGDSKFCRMCGAFPI